MRSSGISGIAGFSYFLPFTYRKTVRFTRKHNPKTFFFVLFCLDIRRYVRRELMQMAVQRNSTVGVCHVQCMSITGRRYRNSRNVAVCYGINGSSRHPSYPEIVSCMKMSCSEFPHAAAQSQRFYLQGFSVIPLPLQPCVLPTKRILEKEKRQYP